MSNLQSCNIHPTALISPEAELGEGVVVGPYVIIEGRARIGPECIFKPFVHVCGEVTMGRGNIVFSGAVLGERPQHLRFNDDPTRLEIGENNIFRENVTVHRGTTQSWATRIGDNNFFMAGSHVAHDCQVGSRCMLANGALLAGHCEVGDNVFISGNAAIHQYVRVGRLALLSGLSASTKDIPPFVIQHLRDTVAGVNVIGMRRAGMPSEEINAVRQAFRIIFREGLTLPVALAHLEKDFGQFAPIQEMIAFLKQTKRGINGMKKEDIHLAA